MSIVILAAETGRGHVSVMRCLEEHFIEHGYLDCKCMASFYESILPSNKILSDFYNFLLTNSTSLCEKYVQFNALTRPDQNEDIYRLTKKSYTELFKLQGLQAIISTATSINYGLIRALKEEGLHYKIPFYIVVTDPYDPIMSGFDIPGATRYFCANETVKDILTRSGIDAARIVITGYPTSKRFQATQFAGNKEKIYQKLGLDASKKTILLNSGSQGEFASLHLLRRYIHSNINENLIMLCGVNKSLYRLAQIEAKKAATKVICILPYYQSMEELLIIADVYITKAGANSFYEALTAKVPILIDAVDGYLYQERGITQMMEQLEIGELVENIDDFIPKLSEVLERRLVQYKSNYKNIHLKNGAETIVEIILSDLKLILNRGVIKNAPKR